MYMHPNLGPGHRHDCTDLELQVLTWTVKGLTTLQVSSTGLKLVAAVMQLEALSPGVCVCTKDFLLLK